ncbi:BON domain-containing protein [Candidatus Bathyarchaeota archaeon]|nr:BON domain-containing protein [Candidatus Bathyarchaeota archaeon]
MTGGTGSANAKPMNDEAIKRAVTDELFWDGRVDASNLTIEVDDGTVVMSGSVPNYAIMGRAVKAINRVPGVMNVRNEIMVDIPEHPDKKELSDTKLEQHLREMIAWDVNLDESDLSISVSDGRVIVEGSTDAFWKLEYMEEFISQNHGIKEILNKVAVVPTEGVYDKQIGEQIIAAIDRNLFVDIDDVDVMVEQGNVTLTGEVNNWSALQAVQDAAQFTRGVLSINNRVKFIPPA